VFVFSIPFSPFIRAPHRITSPFIALRSSSPHHSSALHSASPHHSSALHSSSHSPLTIHPRSTAHLIVLSPFIRAPQLIS
jgi:hypothetical protein